MNTTRLSIFTRSKALGRRLSAFLGLLPLLGLSFMSCSNDIESPPLPEIPVKKLPPLNVSDSLALVKIYQQCGPWGTEWDLKDIRTWGGVGGEYDSISKEIRVTKFEWYHGSFHGEFPKELCQLTELRRLVVSGGTMYGEIPEEIGNLTNLYFLGISRNKMSGKIPESIGKLVKLKKLVIEYNQISGSLPSSIGNLEELEYLDIVETDISGTIPKSFGNLKKLKIAWLCNNKFSGTFPLEAIQHDCYVNCDNNNIDFLPYEYWKDDYPGVPPELRNNRLSGELPDWVFETEKWKHFAPTVVRPQQENYGYNNLRNL